MFKIAKTAALNWKKPNNIYLPKVINVGCPYCKKNPIAFSMEGSWEYRSDSTFKQSVCPACTGKVCFWVIICAPQETLENSPKVTVIYMNPDPSLDISYDPCIDNVSPDFAIIYKQAVLAEANGLNTLVGIGYRKALEFLIKDWAIMEHPKDKEEIKKLLIKDCIKKYIKDTSLSNCVERTIWLGNDQTHYVKTWEDKDIEDLKILLGITLRGLASEIMVKKLPESMPHPSFRADSIPTQR